MLGFQTDMFKVESITVNGQLVAAVAVLLDAIFGVLLALGYVHSKPDQATVVAVVTIAFNLGAYILAYIQHQQHQTQVKLAAQERQLARAASGPVGKPQSRPGR